MCIVSTPKTPAAAPEVAKAPPAPVLKDQTVAGKPLETVQDQLLAGRQGLNQLRILPGISFNKPS